MPAHCADRPRVCLGIIDLLNVKLEHGTSFDRDAELERLMHMQDAADKIVTERKERILKVVEQLNSTQRTRTQADGTVVKQKPGLHRRRTMEVLHDARPTNRAFPFPQAAPSARASARPAAPQVIAKRVEEKLVDGEDSEEAIERRADKEVEAFGAQKKALAEAVGGAKVNGAQVELTGEQETTLLQEIEGGQAGGAPVEAAARTAVLRWTEEEERHQREKSVKVACFPPALPPLHSALHPVLALCRPSRSPHHAAPALTLRRRSSPTPSCHRRSGRGSPSGCFHRG